MADFDQSLDNALFWTLLKGMQVITGSRSPKIFGYLLNHLLTQKSILSQARFGGSDKRGSDQKMTGDQSVVIVEIIGNGSDRARIKARLNSTEERRHLFKS